MSKIDSNPRKETVTELKGRKPLVGLFTVVEFAVNRLREVKSCSPRGVVP